MPVADKNGDHDANHELDHESNRDREKGPKSKGSSKPKDLSHVPCKFFKVGSCTAGSSCPFSHSILEPGQHKDTCAWFVKGNCKFGHKCALAHILPGQSMAMDRKNKKAAQAASSASREGGKGGRAKGGNGGGGGGQGRNPLLSGSTAPTRILHGSTRAPIPMALKATISPSAPAPPLQDSDFAAFGMPDESTKLPSAPAQRKSSTSASNEEPTASDSAPSQPGSSPRKDWGIRSSPSPSPLPASTPSAPRRINDSANSADLGPIGSPRSVSSSHDQSGRVNGFSPGTSPARAPGFLSSSPFSAPGTQSVFFSADSPDNFKARSGIAASLGAQQTWRADFGRLPAGGAHESVGDIVVEDDDLEEFIPGSLSDLLTPEERSRRYSRTNATNAATNLGPGMSSPREGGWGVGPRPSVESHHHRYSRSVPAPSLLGDIKSIWSDNGQGLAVSPRSSAVENMASAGPLGGIVGGTPASHKSGSAFGGRSFVDDHINNFLSPSNASAAFLPGTHQHYLNSKGPVQRTPSGGLRPGAYAPSGSNIPGANAANLLARLNEPLPPQSHTAGHQRQQFDGTSESFNGQPFHLGRPIPQGQDFGGDTEERSTLSPSALALQSHAPGQSLPQGLAAGYSRIHAQPPPPVIPSPSTSSMFSASQSGAFAPGTSLQNNHPTAFTDWIGLSPGKSSMAEQLRGANGPSAGFDPMMTRMSYSSAAAAATRTPLSQAPSGSGPPGIPPPAARTASGKSWAHGGTPLSPLSGPVLTGDDDDLFSMDG